MKRTFYILIQLFVTLCLQYLHSRLLQSEGDPFLKGFFASIIAGIIASFVTCLSALFSLKKLPDQLTEVYDIPIFRKIQKTTTVLYILASIIIILLQ